MKHCHFLPASFEVCVLNADVVTSRWNLLYHRMTDMRVLQLWTTPFTKRLRLSMTLCNVHNSNSNEIITAISCWLSSQFLKSTTLSIPLNQHTFLLSWILAERIRPFSSSKNGIEKLPLYNLDIFSVIEQHQFKASSQYYLFSFCSLLWHVSHTCLHSIAME